MLQKILSWDTSLFYLINHSRSDFLDYVMALLSNSLFIEIIVVLITVFLIWQNKFKYWYLYLIFIGLAIALSDRISVVCFKDVVCRLRPSHALNDAFTLKLQHGDIITSYKGGKYGFVSSHAANIFSVLTFALFSLWKEIKRVGERRYINIFFTIIVLLWGFVTGYSRVYCGYHYPLDVFCGALLGVFIGWLCYWSSSKLKQKFFHNKNQSS